MFGVYIKPMESELGWSRGALSGAAAVSLLLYGASGPFLGRLADRFGPRGIIAICIVLVAVGSLASAFVQELWHVYVTAGLLMGIGAGGVTMTTGSSLIARWFETRRGLAIGLVGAAMSAAQMVVFPLAAFLTVRLGWRTSFMLLGSAVLALALPVGLSLIKNDPEERGLAPYGATGPARTSAQAAAVQKAGRVSVFEAARTPQFWLLNATFFVCGYTSVGLVLTHFMPHALEHGFTELQSAAALGVMGAMNVLGTVGSGWVCDRFGKRGPLATYYFLRGISLAFLLYVWDIPSLHLWAVIFGLNYISTVPPTTALTGSIFGRYSVGELSGWIFFSHQVGGALGAALSGWLFEATGSYYIPFMLGAVLGVAAAFGALAIREEPVRVQPTPLAAPAAS
jgi:MFS family permease